jgi:tetratricopeptide (TPR) repeat protein
MSNKDALKQELLGRFLTALDAGLDGEAAARQAFGDLNRFESTILAYAGQGDFYFTRSALSTATSTSAPVRVLTPAEAAVVRAEFLLRTGESPVARSLLAEALRLAPELARVHSGLAYDEYQQSQANVSPSVLQSHSDAAEKEFRAAVAMGSKDFRVHYYLGLLIYRRNAQAAADIAAELEQAIALNPDFAPAHAFLARAYRQLPGMSEKAVDTVLQAVRMEPSSLTYRFELGDTLLQLRRYDEARTVAESLDKGAQTAGEKTAAQALLQRVMAAQTAAR